MAFGSWARTPEACRWKVNECPIQRNESIRTIWGNEMKFRGKVLSTAMLVAAGLLVSALPSAAAELPSDQSARALSALERAVEHSEIAHQDSSARAAARSSVEGKRKVDSQSTLGRSIRLVDRGTEVDLPGATLQIRFRDDSVQEAAASNGTLTVFGSKSSDYNYAAGSHERSARGIHNHQLCQ